MWMRSSISGSRAELELWDESLDEERNAQKVFNNPECL